MFMIVTDRGTGDRIAVNVSRVTDLRRTSAVDGSYAVISFTDRYYDDIHTVESWETVMDMIGSVSLILP